VAGLSAAAASRGTAPATFSRTESYIGVMIDDLTSRGVTEPYRMFTSRAEFRLTIRADNADRRLTPAGIALGCVRHERQRAFEEKCDRLARGRQQLESLLLGPRVLATAGIAVSADSGKRSMFEALAFPDADPAALCAAVDGVDPIDSDTLHQLQIDSTYGQYADRQSREVSELRRQEDQRIPADLDYAAIPGLSNELKLKMSRHKPETILHASRVEGATPAALLLILSHLRKPRAARAG
jgi:tRNA uridine 5-carboxymethylaminomethyl modification enzyme